MYPALRSLKSKAGIAFCGVSRDYVDRLTPVQHQAGSRLNSSYLRVFSIAGLLTACSWIISCGFGNGLVYNAETKGGSPELWKQQAFLWPGLLSRGHCEAESLSHSHQP